MSRDLLSIINAPWPCEPGRHAQVVDIYMRHVRGDHVDLATIEAQLGKPLERKTQGYEIHDGVAIVPIDGVISKRMNLLTNVSGGASTELISRDITAAVADPAVKAILLQVDSPGGSVDGTQELAKQIFATRSSKPIIAVADGSMMSGAYWIGAAASEVYATSDTAMVGSIGVVMKHVDVSRAEEKVGVKTTEIFAGKYKRIASDYAPLSEEGRATLQGMVDHIYSVFIEDVARFRGVTASAVDERMAQGRIFIGQQALAAGLVDGLSTVDSLISALASGSLPLRASAPARLKLVHSTPAAGAIAGETFEQRCIRNWREDPSLRAEFGEISFYVSFKRAHEAARRKL